MPDKMWKIELDGSDHVILLTHNPWNFTLRLLVDGVEQSATVMSAADIPLRIGNHDGTVHIRTKILRSDYSLSIDGQPLPSDPSIRESVEKNEQRVRKFAILIAIWGPIPICYFATHEGWHVPSLRTDFISIFLFALGLIYLLRLLLVRSV